jgi:KTSC domain
MSWSRMVSSEMATEVGYDSDTGEMLVTWKKTGKVTAYAGVPEDVADQCSRAPSVGQFINTQIKGFYSHRYV